MSILSLVVFGPAILKTNVAVEAVRLNPALEPYLRITRQYVKDAEEAEAEAEKYTELIKEAIPQVAEKVKGETQADLDRIHIKPWSAAVWGVQKLLDNTKPAEAAAAAGAAGAPFAKVATDYLNSMVAYDAVAQEYALRVQADVTHAQQLQGYSRQYQMEGGDPALVENYHQQAVNLMNQAESYEKIAKDYNYMALKMQATIPNIELEEKQAMAHAAFLKDPGTSLPAHEVIGHVVAPPFDPELAPVIPNSFEFA